MSGKKKVSIDQLARINARHEAHLKRVSCAPADRSGIKGRSFANKESPPVPNQVPEVESAEAVEEQE